MLRVGELHIVKEAYVSSWYEFSSLPFSTFGLCDLSRLLFLINLIFTLSVLATCKLLDGILIWHIYFVLSYCKLKMVCVCVIRYVYSSWSVVYKSVMVQQQRLSSQWSRWRFARWQHWQTCDHESNDLTRPLFNWLQTSELLWTLHTR